MKISPEFRKFCKEREIVPERLLEQFQADVARTDGSAGSNEREAAAAYVQFVMPVIVQNPAAYWERQQAAARAHRGQLP